MNRPAIEIEFTEETRAQLAQFRTLPGRILEAIRSGMDGAANQSVSNIQANRLSGQGPYPVNEGKLGVRTDRLRSSLRATPARVISEGTTSTVNVAIGTNVVYARIHEFGGVIKRTVKPGKVRLKTDKAGNLLRQKGGLAIFARNGAKRAREVEYAGGKSYEIKIPARAPIGHGVADNAPLFTRFIGRAIGLELKGGQA